MSGAGFQVGDVVRVDQIVSIGGGWKGEIVTIQRERGLKRYHVELANGEKHYYSADEIALIEAESPERPDAEIASLREQVDTLTRERDAAREALRGQ